MKLAILNSCYVPPSISKPNFDTVFQNTGNSIIYSALKRLIPWDPDLVVTSIFSNNPLSYRKDSSLERKKEVIIDELNRCDVSILILQDLLRPDAYISQTQAELAAEYISASNGLFVFSLGSNIIGYNKGLNDDEIALKISKLLPDHILRLLDLILLKSSLISVRGSITAKVVKDRNSFLGKKVSVGGCPSLSARFLDYNLLKSSIGSNKSESSRYITGGLFSVLRRRSLRHIRHIAQEQKELSRNFNHIISSYQGLPTKSFEGLGTASLYILRKRVFFDPLEWTGWLRKQRSKHSRIVYCGTRFHGLVQALTAGIQGILLAEDSRALEMCRLYGIQLSHGTCVEEAFDLLTADNLELLMESHLAASREFRESIDIIIGG